MQWVLELGRDYLLTAVCVVCWGLRVKDKEVKEQILPGNETNVFGILHGTQEVVLSE